MSVKIVKKTLKNKYFQFNSMLFLPPKSTETPYSKTWALYTHGYTASKSDCIAWASRLSDSGINCAIFDLPGHHLGSYNAVNSFEEFKTHAHECFLDAYHFLKDEADTECETLIIGGHSLGALLSLEAMSLGEFQKHNLINISVGYGLNQSADTHIFDTTFYQKTINIRRQLVDPHLDSDLVFPWVKEHKEDINIEGKRIHLITGEDDVVVGKGGMEYLANVLKLKQNIVSTSEPKKMPHNEPSLAASHIFSFLKKELKA